MPAQTHWDRPGSLPTYLPWLDLLRFVACVLVILAHLNPYPAAGGLGHNGVGLFFSVSGYLIGTVILNAHGRPYWKTTFYANRFLRIYPPLLLGLLFFGTLVAAGFGSRPEMWEMFRDNLPYYLTFTAQLSPSRGDPFAIVWTLCVEEYFYLLLPAVVGIGGRRGMLAILIAVFGLIVVPRLHHLPDGSDTWFLIPVNLLTGAILATLRPAPRAGRPWLGTVGLAAVIANAAGGWFHPFGPVMGTVTTLVVWSFATTRTSVPGLLQVPVLWGKWSYGIYLIHLPFCSAALATVRAMGIAELGPVPYYAAAAVLATLGATALAGLMFRVVERPILDRRSRITDRPRLRTLVAAFQVSLVPIGVLYWLMTGGWRWWSKVVVSD